MLLFSPPFCSRPHAYNALTNSAPAEQMHKAAFPSIKDWSRNEIHWADILGRQCNPPMFINTSVALPILQCLTPTIPCSTWLIFAIKRGNLPTCGKQAPISKGRAPAVLKCPHRGRNDVPSPMRSSGGLGRLHPHTRRAQGTEQHQPTTPSSKDHLILPSDLPFGNPFFGHTQQTGP